MIKRVAPGGRIFEFNLPPLLICSFIGHILMEHNPEHQAIEFLSSTGCKFLLILLNRCSNGWAWGYLVKHTWLEKAGS